MNAKPLFLYVKDTLEPDAVAQIKKNGYVPVCVDTLQHLECCKILLPMPTHATNEIIQAAMTTILENGIGSSSANFGHRVAQILKR